MTRPDHNIWPAVSYRDAAAAIRWLVALGFTEELVIPGEAEGEIHHSELAWPDGGRVMVQSLRTRLDPQLAAEEHPGSATLYVVCTDPDAVHRRAVALGAEETRPLKDETDYPSRGFSIRDPEGNGWSFGTYSGA